MYKLHAPLKLKRFFFLSFGLNLALAFKFVTFFFLILKCANVMLKHESVMDDDEMKIVQDYSNEKSSSNQICLFKKKNRNSSTKCYNNSCKLLNCFYFLM